MGQIKNRSGMPWSILYSKKLTANAKLVFIALKDRAYQIDKNCVEGFLCKIDWLSANLNMDRKTIETALKSLKNANIISSNRVRMYGITQNEWKINWDLIDEIGKKFRFATENIDDIDTVEEISTTVEEISTPPAEEETTIVQTEIKKEQSDDEDMGYRSTTVEDVIERPELSFLLDDDEITLEVEIAMAANKLSNINNSADYYKTMNSIVTTLHNKYNVSKKYVDEMINNKINQAA